MKSILGIFASLSFFAACGSKSQPSANVKPKAAAEKIKDTNKTGKDTNETGKDGSDNQNVKMETENSVKVDSNTAKIENAQYIQLLQGKWIDQGQACLPSQTNANEFGLNSGLVSGLNFNSALVSGIGQIGQKGGNSGVSGLYTIVVQGTLAQVFVQQNGVQNQVGQGEIEILKEQIQTGASQGQAKLKLPTSPSIEESLFSNNQMYLTTKSSDCDTGTAVQKYVK